VEEQAKLNRAERALLAAGVADLGQEFGEPVYSDRDILVWDLRSR